MKRLVTALIVAVLLVPILAVPASAAWARGGWHGSHGGGYGYRHGGSCCWGGFAAGLGVGALLTAPFWYRPAYADRKSVV